MNHRTPAEERLAAANAARKPVAEMSTGELTALLDSFTPADSRRMLAHLAGAAPDAFDGAVRRLIAVPGLTVLARIHVHLFGQDGICAQCDIDIATWSQAQGDAELDHIAIEGTLS